MDRYVYTIKFFILNPEILKGQRPGKDIVNPKNGKVILKKGKLYTKKAIKELQDANIELLPFTKGDLLGRVVAGEIFDPKTGELIAKSNDTIDEEIQRNEFQKIPGILPPSALSSKQTPFRRALCRYG